MGITLRNGVDEMGIKSAGKMGINEMGSYRPFMEHTWIKTECIDIVYAIDFTFCKIQNT